MTMGRALTRELLAERALQVAEILERHRSVGVAQGDRALGNALQQRAASVWAACGRRRWWRCLAPLPLPVATRMIDDDHDDHRGTPPSWIRRLRCDAEPRWLPRSLCAPHAPVRGAACGSDPDSGSFELMTGTLTDFSSRVVKFVDHGCPVVRSDVSKQGSRRSQGLGTCHDAVGIAPGASAIFQAPVAQLDRASDF